MKRLITALALFIAVRALAQTAADEIAAGRTALAAQDLATAQADFQQALTLDPTNQTAGALLGATQLINVANQASSQTLLNDIGVAASGRDLYDWTAKFTQDANGNAVFPSTFNTSEVFGFWHDTLVPECEAARANLALVTDPAFLLTLSPAETDSPASLNVDYGDVLAARAALRGAEFAMHFLEGNNLNVSPATIQQLMQGNLLTLETLLTEYPDLLKPGTPGERAAALAALTDFVQTYEQASTFIRNRPAGVQRLFMLDPSKLPDEANFRTILDKVVASLSGFVEVDPKAPLIDAAPLFTDSFSLRGLLPTITDATFNPFALPDPSMGGVFSGFPSEVAIQVLQNLAQPDLGWQWLNPTPLGTTYAGYAYGNGVHVVVGALGNSYSSTDGINWTHRDIPGKPTLNSVIYAASQFVAVGKGCSYYSTDGTTWTRGTGIDGNNYFNLAHGAGRFVAVGNNGALATSTDGMSWTSSSVGFGENYHSVVYSGSQFVAVGGSRVISSTDGLSWSSATTVTGVLNAVATDGTKYVAVGAGNLLVTSANGTAWTSGTVLTGANPAPSFSSVAYRSGLFIAAGGTTVNNGAVCALASSSDGSAWTVLSTSQPGNINSMNAGPDGFYGLGAGGFILRSTDGVAFAIPSGFPFQNADPVFGSLNGLQSFGGGFYAFGAGGSLLVSSDGTTFTPVATGTSNNLYGASNQAGTAFLVGQNGTILSSTDGTTWGAAASGTTNTLVAINNVNGLYVAVGAGGTVVTSPDGTNWNVRSLNVTSVPAPWGSVTGTITLYGVAYGNGVYLAVGGIAGTGAFSGTNLPAVFISTDGTTWSPSSITNTAATALRGVVFRDGIFTAVGTNGSILRSRYGAQWDSAASSGELPSDFLSINVLADGRYWATASASGTSGQSVPAAWVAVSSNGDQWFRCPLPTVMNPNAAQLFLDHVYVCGGSTSILRTNVTIPGVAKPTVFQAPLTQAVPAGSSVTLAAGVTGEGVLTYQWQKNGVDIEGATGRTLTLTNVQSGDATSYTVIVTNDAGSVSSGAAVLTVTPQAPVISVPPASQSVPQNWTVAFQVSATGTAPFTYQWMNGSATLTDGGRVSGSTSATLTITGVQPADVGSYSVVVTNSVGSTPSNPASLTISPADPVFSTQLTPWATEQSPGRTINDGNGHIYSCWSIFDHSYDILGGRMAGPLARVSEATGAYDPTFRLDRRYQNVTFVAQQADGKLVLAVDNGDVATVIRVDSTGVADPGFAAPLFARPMRFITMQPDGRILVTTDSVTTANPPAGALSLDSGGIFRLNTDGTLDSTFTPAMVDNGDAFFAAPVLDGSGRVYIVGSFVTVNGTACCGIARLSSAGALDATYASPAILPAGAAFWRVRGIGFQSNGKAVAVGRMTYSSRGSSSDPVVAIRLNTDGSFDTTFTCPLRSSLGLGPSGLYLRAMVMQPADQFVAVSDRLLRFNADGSLDSAFTTYPFDREAYWVSQGSDGRFYVPGIGAVAGPSGPIQLWNNGIAAFSSNGVPDTSFKTAGWGRSAFPASATVLSDGRVWVAGDFNQFAGVSLPAIAQFLPSGALSATQASPTGPDDFLSLPSATLAAAGNDQVYVNWGVDIEDTGGGFAQLSRLNSDGSIDPGFSPQLPNNYPLGNAAMTAAPNGAVILALSTVPANEALYGNLNDSLLRLKADGSRDYGIPSLPNLASVNRNSNNQITNINVGGIRVLQALPDGRILVAESGIDGNVRIGRLLAGGSIDTSFQNLSFGTVTPNWGYSNVMTDPATGQQGQFQITDFSNGTSLVTSALQLSDGRVYVGGRFNIGGSPCGLLRLNADGSLDASFAGVGVTNDANPIAAPYVASLAIDATGRLYVAGRFDHFNGTAVQGLFRLNADGTLDAGCAPGTAVLDYASSSAFLNYASSDIQLLVVGEKLYAFGEVGAPTDSFPGFYRVLDTTSEFKTQPSDQAVASGGTVSFTATVTISNPALQWMVSTDGGNTWTNLTDSGPYSGTATGTLTITGATAAMNGDQYQCVASNSVQSNVASSIATLIVTQTSITPASQVVGPEQVPYQILVNSNWNWTATTNVNWVTLSRTSGAEDANILVTAAANTTGADRTATITVNGVTHTLTQRGAAIQELWGFGGDDYGQLGDNVLLQNLLPVQVAENVQTVATGGAFSLIVKTDASLWATGYNYDGQLGDGTTTSHSSPVQILSGGVQAVAAGSRHSLILKTDGSLWAMGNNSYGQLGIGTSDSNAHDLPVQILSGGVQAIDAGRYHSLILKTDGSLWAMGRNSQGQLGDGTTTQRNSPVEILAGGVKAIAGGWAHSLIVKTDGSLWAMGDNSVGQLGDGTTNQQDTPEEILSGGVRSVVAAYGFSLVVKTDGSLWAMGDNSFGQLGDGTTNQQDIPEEILSGGVQSVVGFNYSSLIVKTDGSLCAMGDNSYGQLGDGTTTQQDTPVGILSGKVRSVATGGAFSLIVKTDGSLWGMGDNLYGQLGDGAALVRGSPIQVLSGVVRSVTAGDSFSLVFKTDGSLWGMGYNYDGELGDSTTTNSSSPVQIYGGGVQSVAAGDSHSLVVKTDGSLWTMGANGSGQLGDGTTNGSLIPEQILPDGIQSVSAGGNHSLFVKTDGSLWAMGDNSSGQLGDGTTTQQDAPEEILSSGVQSVSAGYDFSLIVKTDGSLWAMGDNSSGQLGDGSTTQQDAPEEILSSGVQSVSAGYDFSLIVKTDGSLWAMGDNSSGQLGDGTNTQRNAPEEILSGGVQAISAGWMHSLILKTDGSLWAMGDNQYGELGDGTWTNRNTPELVAANVQEISAGSDHSLIVATGGITPAVPQITAQPLDQTLTAGGTTTFTATALGNPTPTYQWQVSSDGGTTWTNLTDTGPYSGTATATLTITGATGAMNGYQYQCLASNAVESNVASSAATLTVDSAPGFATEPANQTVAAGGNASFTAGASGNPTPTYQWQVSTDGGHTWTNLTDTALYSGTTTGTLNITSASVALNNCQYQCVASNSVQGNVVSNKGNLTVTPSSSTPFPLGTAGPQVQVGMSAAFDGANYLVGFQQNPSSQDTVGAELFSGTGTAMVPYLSTGLLGGIGTVAFDGTNYLMIWGNDGSGDTPISGCFIDTAGAFVGTAFQISDHGGNGNYGLVYGGGQYLVWWSPQGGTTVNARFVPASLAQSGSLSTGSFVVNPSGSTAVPVGMGAGFDGTNFLVAWETQLGSGGYEIDGSFLSTSGSIGSPFAISQTPFASATGLLSVAYDGSSDYLVLWDSVDGSGSSIYARAVGRDGTFPADEFAVAFGSYPAAASDGANFLITWADYPNYPSVSGSSIDAQFFNALGQPQGAAITPFSGIAGNGLFAQPLFDGTQFLIVGFIGTSDVVGDEFSSGATYGTFVAPSVNTGPIFTTQPASQSVSAGTNVSFAAIASGNPSPTYQWQVSSNGGSTWTNLSNAAPYSGTSSDTLTITGVTTAMSGYQYHCLASNSVKGNVPSKPATLTVAKASQTVNFPAPGNKVYGSAPFNVSGSATSGLPVTFSVVSGPATISGTTVTLTGAGLVTLAADQAGNANYNAAPEVTHSFTVVKATATVTLGGLSATYNGKPQAATATTTPTGLTVTFTYNGSATAPTNVGSYAVVGTVSDTNYQGSAKGTLVIAKASQTINFPAPGNKVYGSAPFNVGASATSGLAVTFSVVSGPATISGNTVTLTGAGLVTLAADQAGNANYNAATEVTHSFTVVKAVATVTLGGMSATYNGKPHAATATTTPTGLTVTFTYNGSATAPTNAGSYAVVGTINDANYQGSAKGTLVIAKAAQTISFPAPGSKVYGSAPFKIGGSATSGLAVTFSVVSGPATISGTTVTLTGAGVVMLAADQAGNANYNAATEVTHSFTVVKATATVTLGGLSATYNGKPHAATATTTPTGLTVTFTYNGSATAPTNAGSYAVVGTVSDANYQGSAKGTLVIAKAAQTISFPAPGNKSHTAPPFTLSASATSGLPVTFTVVSGPATISGKTVTLTGALGTVTLRASQAGNANYNAATSVDHSFAVK